MLGKSQKEMASVLGMAQNSYSNVETGKRGMTPEHLISLKEMHDVSSDWLLHGTGQPFLSFHGHTDAHLNAHPSAYPSARSTQSLAVAEDFVHYGSGGLQQVDKRRLIPVLTDFKAAAGALLADDAIVQQEYLEEAPQVYLPGVRVPGTWYAFEVEGDSMYPTIQERDILVCRMLERDEPIKDNYVHVVVSKTEGLLVKRVISRLKSHSSLLLRSDNRRYAPYNMSPEDVHSLWMVHRRITASLAGPDTLEHRVVELENKLDALIADQDDKPRTAMGDTE